jgi:hypothetical protein
MEGGGLGLSLRRPGLAWVLVLGCNPSEAPEGETSAGSAEDDDDDSNPSSAPEDDDDDGDDDDDSSPSDTGADSTTSVSTSGDDPSVTDSMTDTTPTSDTDPIPLRLCSLEALDPAADPTAVIEYGDGEGQIPTVIGELLLRNCGCHYTDNVAPGPLVDYKSNAQPMATHADFHGNFTGIFPMGFEEMPAHVGIAERVVNHMPLPMPPFLCQVEGEMGTISAADQQLITQWLEAAAPDGANFP